MDFQLLFSLAFAYGVLTLASIALFNVASNRLFDVQKVDKQDDDPKSTVKCVFEFIYVGGSAGRLKKLVEIFPLAVGLSGAIVGTSWGALCIAYALRTDENNGYSLSAVALATLASYVASLVVFTTVVSTRLRNAIQDVKLAPRNPFATDGTESETDTGLGSGITERPTT